MEWVANLVGNAAHHRSERGGLVQSVQALLGTHELALVFDDLDATGGNASFERDGLEAAHKNARDAVLALDLRLLTVGRWSLEARHRIATGEVAAGHAEDREGCAVGTDDASLHVVDDGTRRDRREDRL